MVTLYITLAVIVLVCIAEVLHASRCRRVAMLAFGPTKAPRLWVRAAPALRVASLGCLTWGLITLLMIQAKVHRAETVPLEKKKHLVLVLDVSPSVKIQDAGPDGMQSRRQRCYELMESFFKRVPLANFGVSVVAVYNGAMPVVVDTKDLEVVRNILDDLPLHYAFKSGKTDLFAGIEEAFKIARPWPPKSTIMMLLTDGDTVPSTGMPKMPVSIDHAVVVGVGNSRVGKFINGQHSRQDASTLRQVAVRLRGIYHDGNQRHLSSELIRTLSAGVAISRFERLGLREGALFAIGVGATVLALLPLCLHYWGTAWQPGTSAVRWRDASSYKQPRQQQLETSTQRRNENVLH